MAYRKFFYGDTVLVNDTGYTTHEGQTGQITGTLIGTHHVYYRVACECGKNISPLAPSLDLVTTPHEDPAPQTVQEIRMEYFLRRVGVAPRRDALKKQVKTSLSAIKKVRDRKILTQRFGMDGSEGKSLQEIGDDYGLTRQRVQQIEAQLLGTIRHKLGKEKHGDRIETPA